jgi:uridine kinase
MSDYLSQIEHEIAKCKDKQKIIVGIDGYSGMGKTTILAKLAQRNPNFAVINRDDFTISRKSYVALLEQAEDKSIVWETKILDLQKIYNLIDAFRASNSEYQTTIFNPKSGECDIEKRFDLSKRILVIEGIFLFHPKQLKDTFDVRIFLDGDMEATDERRRKREKEKLGKDYFPDDHPDSYCRQIKIAFDRYLKVHKPKEFADIVVSVLRLEKKI